MMFISMYFLLSIIFLLIFTRKSIQKLLEEEKESFNDMEPKRRLLTLIIMLIIMILIELPCDIYLYIKYDILKRED